MVNSTAFCQDSFWDQDLFWNGNTLQFTHCFRDSVVLIVCGFFWILCIPWILWLCQSSTTLVLKTNPPKSWLFGAKIIVNIGLLAMVIWDIYLEKSNEELFIGDLLYSIGFPLTLLICILLTIYERRKRCKSSLVQSLFWPLLLIGYVPQILHLVQAFEETKTSITLAEIFVFIFIFGLATLNLFADLSGIDLQARNVAPKQLASYASSLIFGWLEPLVIKGYRSPLVQNDLPIAPDSVDVTANVEAFMKNWTDYQHSQKVDFSQTSESNMPRKRLSLLKPLLKSFGLQFTIGNLIGLLHYSVTFTSPMVLKLLIDHLSSESEEPWKGYLYATLLFLVSIVSTFSYTHYVVNLGEVAIQTRSALISAIFRKSLRLSSAARQKFTSGEITNLVSVDTQRVLDNIPYMGLLWGAPYQVVLALILLYNELGVSALIGSLGVLVLIPPNLVGGKVVESLQEKQMAAKDSRIKLMNEIISGMKVLKLYAWELPFMKRIGEIRAKEVQFLKFSAWLAGVINFTFCMSPFLVTIATFSSYVLLDPENHVLTPTKVFVSVSLFNLLKLPLTLFPWVLKETITMMVSVRRMTDFLNADELALAEVRLPSSSNNDNVIEVQDGTFSWSNDSSQLHNISFKVPSGNLTAIVGAVGSGKSSLLQAIMGEMKTMKGNVSVNGSIAYVPQQAWIQNLSLKDNVLFAKPWSESLYKSVIQACALEADLTLLSNGDETEIGENGINLSGGQKQRVSLARAVYYDADVYLLDDPLSAVDSHVGKHIFENVIHQSTGLLSKKTKVWVTNQVSYLSNVDQIIYMKDGQILEQGTYKELMQSKGPLYNFVEQHLNDEEDEAAEKDDDEKKVKNEGEFAEGDTSNDGKLIEDETSLTGHVPLYVFKDLIKKVGPWLFVLYLLLVGLEHGFHAGGILWLADWSDSPVTNTSSPNDDASFRLGVYSALGISEAITLLGRDVFFFIRLAVTAKFIHEDLLKGVLQSPMQFFDTHPLGRIINRFSSDMDTFEQLIPWQLSDAIWCFAEFIVTLIMISYALPIFLTVIVPIVLFFFMVQRIYIVTSRQIKRLYSVSKSPIFSHFSETVAGAETIRAFKQNERFVRESEDKVMRNVQSYYPSMISNRWLSIRVESIANIMIFVTAIFAVLKKDSMDPGIAAMAITYAINVTGSVVWMVRMACDLENNCVCLERIFEYAKLPSEANWDSTEKEKKSLENWPSEGKIEFKDYQTRYREGMDLVLRGIDFQINPEEKIGICGRTGAGKSSLTLALFRIIEPAGGSIYIDNIDVTSLGLHDLRSKLSIIPQDPVLFTGSLRFNLDPLGEHSDANLWNALQLSHLKNHVVQNLTKGLDHEVSEGGSNFSVGQRQLICLARALLRRAKILVLDEATAAVDPETDELIQTTIRKEFSHCTVLTIAHRLNTILDSDRILVLSKGQVEEVDSPLHLLKNPNSSFRAMAKDAGIALK